MKEMKFSNINPFIRYAQFLTISSNRQYVDLAPYDCRLFFCRGGSGIISVDGQDYEMKLGSVLCWQAGVKYSLLLAPHSTHFDLMQVNFDYTQECCNLADPIGPSKWQHFNLNEIVEQVSFVGSGICFTQPTRRTDRQKLKAKKKAFFIKLFPTK